MVLLALIYSAAIEISQLWIPDRFADIDDVLLNVLGALLGFGVWRVACPARSN